MMEIKAQTHADVHGPFAPTDVRLIADRLRTFPARARQALGVRYTDEHDVDLGCHRCWLFRGLVFLRRPLGCRHTRSDS